MGGTENPLADQAPWLLAVAVASTILLAVQERRAKWALLPVSLYRRRPFLATIVTNTCIGAVLMVSMVNVPVVVALTADPDRVSATSAAMLAPFTIAIVAGSLAAGAVSARAGERRALFAGAGLAAMGCLLVSLLLNGNAIWAMIPGLAISGLGVGLLLPALGSLPIQLAGSGERGAAASSALMFRLLGMTVGVSLLTALGVRRLQTLTGRLDPIVREPDESTASFLVRQRDYVVDVAIPLSIQVIQETFVAAALIALLAAIPIALLGDYLHRDGGSQAGDMVETH
jgi:MFS family permease